MEGKFWKIWGVWAWEIAMDGAIRAFEKDERDAREEWQAARRRTAQIRALAQTCSDFIQPKPRDPRSLLEILSGLNFGAALAEAARKDRYDPTPENTIPSDRAPETGLPGAPFPWDASKPHSYEPESWCARCNTSAHKAEETSTAPWRCALCEETVHEDFQAHKKHCSARAQPKL